MLHVEVIQNEWAAGSQRVVGRVTVNGTGGVQVEAAEEAPWSSVLVESLRDPGTGDELSAKSDPERFVRSLHLLLHGDYLFATEAHEDGECEYAVGQMLPLHVVSLEKHAHEALR
jgi:hypothetical protein